MRKEFNVHRIVLVHQRAMAAVSLFRNTNMAAVTPSENDLQQHVSTHLSHAVQNVNGHIDMQIKQKQQTMRIMYLLYSFVQRQRLVKFTGQVDNSVPAPQKGSVERFGQVDILTLEISNNNVKVLITR